MGQGRSGCSGTSRTSCARQDKGDTTRRSLSHSQAACSCNSGVEVDRPIKPTVAQSPALSRTSAITGEPHYKNQQAPPAADHPQPPPPQFQQQSQPQQPQPQPPLPLPSASVPQGPGQPPFGPTAAVRALWVRRRRWRGRRVQQRSLSVVVPAARTGWRRDPEVPLERGRRDPSKAPRLVAASPGAFAAWSNTFLAWAEEAGLSYVIVQPVFPGEYQVAMVDTTGHQQGAFAIVERDIALDDKGRRAIADSKLAYYAIVSAVAHVPVVSAMMLPVARGNANAAWAKLTSHFQPKSSTARDLVEQEFRMSMVSSRSCHVERCGQNFLPSP